MSKAKDEYYKILDSDKIELTEEQAREMVCTVSKKTGDLLIDFWKHKKYIKRSPVEKAEETLNYIKSEKKPLMTYRLTEYELDNIVNGFNDLKKQLEKTK